MSTESSANLALVQRLHTGDRPMRELLIDVADPEIEWIIPGPSELLPWAGTWRGVEGIRRQTALLREHLQYDDFEVVQWLADGDDVILLSRTRGRALRSGRPFTTDGARVFTVHAGKVVRVRTYVDTGAYLAAMYPEALAGAHR